MLDGIIAKNSHPLVRETRRECVEDQWDIAGLEYVLNGIRSGMITVHEVHVEIPLTDVPAPAVAGGSGSDVRIQAPRCPR